jgi:hypothetical protein
MFVPCKHVRCFAIVADRLVGAAPKHGNNNWKALTGAGRQHRRQFFRRQASSTSSPPVVPAAVQIVEVGPRDGLQNEAHPVSTADKVRLITQLAAAGCSRIEAGSFVSPRWVPNMAHSAQVLEGLVDLRKEKAAKLQLSCLVPNLKYLEQAIQARVDEIAIFASASEAFSQKVRRHLRVPTG